MIEADNENALLELWKGHGEWLFETFGPRKEPIGALKHLQEEAQEAINAWRSRTFRGTTDNYKEELADCLFLWFSACRGAGINDLQEVIPIAKQKLEKLKTRTYPPPAYGEPSHHEKESTYE